MFEVFEVLFRVYSVLHVRVFLSFQLISITLRASDVLVESIARTFAIAHSAFAMCRFQIYTSDFRTSKLPGEIDRQAVVGGEHGVAAVDADCSLVMNNFPILWVLEANYQQSADWRSDQLNGYYCTKKSARS